MEYETITKYVYAVQFTDYKQLTLNNLKIIAGSNLLELRVSFEGTEKAYLLVMTKEGYVKAHIGDYIMAQGDYVKVMSREEFEAKYKESSD